MRADFLTPEQVFGAAWLLDRPGSYLADPPGFGKTRQILAACESERHVTVVCPAAIRDAKVWEREASAVGFDVPMSSMSYHQLANTAVKPGGALVFDEAHRLKSRKVGWNANAEDAAAVSTRVHLASGTPTPNGITTELYAQLRLINPTLPDAYWKNKAGTGWVETWFHISSNRYSDWVVDGRLLACMGLPCEPVTVTDCEHRSAFWAANVGDLMLRRPEESLDLPEMAGFDSPMWAPMTTAQRRAYNGLKKDLLADLPEDGITLEALSATSKFVMLLQSATGLSSAEPDPKLDRHSGKRALLEELLPDRSHPTVLGVYFRNTAAAMARMCTDLKLSYALYGADTPHKDRVIESFQRGEVDVLIASIMVAREGITLTAADQVALVERSWVPGDNEQMVRRVRRRGQTKAVTVRQLVAPNCVEDAQWDVVNNKAERIGAYMSKAELIRRL